MGWRDWLNDTVFRRFDLTSEGSTAATSTARADSLDSKPTPQLAFLGERTDSWDHFWDRIDSLSNALTGLGGANDKGASARPDTTAGPLTYSELTFLYWKNGLSNRIVSSVAEDAVKNGWKTEGDFSEIDQRLGIQQKIGQALTFARVYGGAGILMITNQKDLSKPMGADEKLQGLHVFERIEMQPLSWEGDIQSPSFREVKEWQLTPLSPALNGGWSGRAKVHASRMLYVDGAEIPAAIRLANQGFGGSVLDPAWDAVRNRTTIGQTGAAMAQDFRVDVLKVSGLAAKSVSDQAAWFQTRMSMMARMRSVLSLTVVGENEEYLSRATSVSGWKDLTAAAAEDLAAATGIPLTRLYGLAPGGLNADGDSQREMHGAMIARVQEQRLRGPLQKYYAVAGQTTGQKAGWIEFNSIYQPTPEEQEKLRQMQAITDQTLIESGVLDPLHVARSRFGPDSDGGILPLEDADLAEMAGQAEAMAAAAIAMSQAQSSDPAEPEEDEEEPTEGE